MIGPVLETAVVAGALACGAAGIVAALRARAAARADRLALRAIREREAFAVDAGRRLADAARRSADAVREELTRAARALAPALDGLRFYEEHCGALRCVYAAGDRVRHYAGSAIARDDGASPAVRALDCGHRVADGATLALPLAREPGQAAVAVLSARGPFDPGAIERLATLGAHAAVAYGSARERERDLRRAEEDALTGLLTPRAFRTRLAALLERARLDPAARLALLFVDTDRFKDWNDRYGHAAGDALLRALARLLREAARAGDELVARNGGDEFCLVFTGSGKAAAIERAEALRRRIAESAFGGEIRITASIGVAAFPDDAATAAELLERADAAMYHSKRTGRDGVSYAGLDGAPARLGPAVLL